MKTLLLVIMLLGFADLAMAQTDSSMLKKKQGKQWNNEKRKGNDEWKGKEHDNRKPDSGWQKRKEGMKHNKNKDWKNDQGKGNDEWKDKDNDDRKGKGDKEKEKNKENKDWKNDQGKGNDEWKDKDNDDRKTNGEKMKIKEWKKSKKGKKPVPVQSATVPN